MIKIGIAGYGNLGRGVECAIKNTPDMELIAVFTRRDPASVQILTKDIPVVSSDLSIQWKDKIDVMILCGGSATDLPTATPAFVEMFNVVDSFDNHAKIPAHFSNVDAAAKKHAHLALIAAGWDPGLFSVNRLYGNVFLPGGKDYTFWGKGVSQGHSDAIRRIDGVKNAKQYTIPVQSALHSVRSGSDPELTTDQKHTRECFVVLEKGANASAIKHQIKTMPNYFADYNTTVHFISEEEFSKNHTGMAHGGFVIRSGRTGVNKEHSHIIEYNLKLDSNPEFTASVLVAYARAVYRMANEGIHGCKTVLDVPPSYLSEKSGDELRATLL
ncbi:MAG: diaminopimelate dehydrogenase [Chitinispirillaceae bacterium]|nr:diaminopimelate dehydrogenase [Chitinispirillaceae bacterium]